MATIIANKKNGKIVSYKFRAYLGKNEFGEQILKYTTLVYMIDKDCVEGTDGLEGFKKFLSDKTKLEWKKPFSILALNLATIKDLIEMNSRKKVFTADRLENRKH